MRIAIAMMAGLPAVTAAAVVGVMSPAPPLTAARIAGVAPDERRAWNDYLARSAAAAARDRAMLARERRNRPYPAPPPTGRSGGSGMPLDRAADWYAGAEARHAADVIVSFQTPTGGWGKNVDRSGPLRQRGQFYVPVEHLPSYARGDIQANDDWVYVGTLDNNASTTEVRFLARVQASLPGREGEGYRASALKGIRYLLAAQFPNGGWPQVYPLQGGYHDAITFNDDAVTLAATTLMQAGEAKGDWSFVTPAVSREAHAAAGRAVELILRTQVRIDGARTIWGQQHDPLTLAPVGARNFEPLALASTESADLLLFLMRQPEPSPAMREAIHDGVSWLETHGLRNVAWVQTDQGRRLVPDVGAGQLWARFYAIDTGKPIFGDRDRSIHDDVNDIGRERRDGYSWFNASPAKVITAYAKWRRRFE